MHHNTPRVGKGRPITAPDRRPDIVITTSEAEAQRIRVQSAAAHAAAQAPAEPSPVDKALLDALNSIHDYLNSSIEVLLDDHEVAMECLETDTARQAVDEETDRTIGIYRGLYVAICERAQFYHIKHLARTL